MSNSLRGIIAAAVVAMGVTQADAAQVQPDPPGQTLVNGQTIPGTVTVPPGSQVTTRNGSARIFHDNGCTQVVPAYSTEIVQADPVCDTGAVTLPWMALVGTGVIAGLAAWQLTDDNGPISRPHSP